MIIDRSKELQVILDQAWAHKDEVVLQPGTYSINNPLVAHCSVRGIGNTILKWVGKETNEYMLSLVGESGWLYRPHISGINFHGNNKARGLLVDNVHGATISDVRLYACYDLAMGGTRAWQVHLINVAADYGVNCRAFDLRGFSASTIKGMVVSNMTCSDGPMVSVSGGCTIDQLGLANCDAGLHPAVRIEKSWGGRLTGLHTEQLRCSAILRIDKSFGVVVENTYHWQDTEHVIPYAVLVTSSEACAVRRVTAFNISEALVKLDWYSSEHGCTAPRELIREGYGQNWGIQPKRIVEYVGRGKGD